MFKWIFLCKFVTKVSEELIVQQLENNSVNSAMRNFANAKNVKCNVIVLREENSLCNHLSNFHSKEFSVICIHALL